MGCAPQPLQVIFCAVLCLVGMPLIKSRVPGSTGEFDMIFKYRPLSYDTSVSLDRGISYLGDPARLHRALQKLTKGRGPQIAILGSSLSTNRGASFPDGSWPARVHKWMEASFTPCGKSISNISEVMSSHSSQYIATGHLCTQSNVVLNNFAVHASVPAFAEKCILHRVPSDVDLVIFEYSISDISRSFDIVERILRRLINLPSKPAVIMLHPYCVKTAQLNFTTFDKPFLEDVYTTFAQYYGVVQVVSVRDVMYHWFRRNWGTDLPYALIDRDNVHLTDAGHQLYADLLIHFFQKSIVEVRLAASLPWPTANLNTQGKPYEMPSPMFPDNYEQNGQSCFINKDLQQILHANKGWKWVDEGDAQAHKYGYVSWQPGSTISFGFSTLQDGNNNTGSPVLLRDKPTVVYLMYLWSYQHMGQANVSCSGGCLCHPHTLNGLIADTVSIIAVSKPIYVSQSDSCIIVVEVLAATDSKEHKFKVIGVVLHNSALNPGDADLITFSVDDLGKYKTKEVLFEQVTTSQRGTQTVLKLKT